MNRNRQEKSLAQERKEARRQSKDRLIELVALTHQLAQTVLPDAPTHSANSHSRKQLYRELRGIFQDLGRDEIGREALFRLNTVLDGAADLMKRSMAQLKVQLPRTGSGTAPPAVTDDSMVGQVIQLMGSTGLARTEAIDRALKERAICATNARDILRAGAALPPDSRWVEPLLREGVEVRYHTGRRGRAMRLWLLTAEGRARYRTLTGQEPVESELIEAMRQPGHSLDHALGIIELAEVLERLGCTIDRKPAPIRVDETSVTHIRQTPHIVPDLVIRQSPPSFLPNLIYVEDIIVEYEMNGKAAGSHGEQWAKRAERLGLCVIVLPNPEQQVNMRYELERARQYPAFRGFTLTAYLANLSDLMRGQVEWQVLVLRNS